MSDSLHIYMHTRTMHNKDGVWNGVLNCVFVEVAGSYEQNFNLTVSWDGV